GWRSACHTRCSPAPKPTSSQTPSAGSLPPNRRARSILAGSVGRVMASRGSSVASNDSWPARSFLPRRRPCNVRRRVSNMSVPCAALHHHVDQVGTLLRHGVGELLGQLIEV